MPARFLFGLICCCPLLLWGQEWKLQPQYPVISEQRLRIFYGPEHVPAAFAPDSVLSYYQPDDDPGLQGILEEPSFASGAGPFSLEPGDVLWMKVECINIGVDPVRYLMEVDQHYPLWATVDLFEVKGDSVLQTIHTGNQLPAAAKPIRNARNLFWLNFAAGEGKTLFFRLVSDMKQHRSKLSLSILDPTEIRDFEGYTFRGYNNPIPYRFDKIPHAQVLHSLEYLIDSSGEQSFTEIRQNWDQYAQFLREKDIFRHKGKAIWCQMTLINPDTIGHPLLLDAAGDTKIIDVYLPQHNGDYRMVRTGNKASKAEKVIGHTFNLFDYTITPLDTAHIFLHYHAMPESKNWSVTSLVLGVFIFEPFALMTETKNAGIRKGMIMGILLFQLFYFLLRSLLEKNKLGLYYALMILGFSFLFIILENRVNTFIAWRLLLYQRPYLITLAPVLFSFGIFYFTELYLRYRSVFPRIYKLQKLLLWIIVVIQLCYFIQEKLLSSSMNDGNSVFFNLQFVPVSVGILVIALLLYIILAVLAYFKKIPYATNFLIAFSPFFLTFIFTLGTFAIVILSQRDHMFNIMYGGFSLTSVLFAVVGARRYNEMKIKEAQAESLIALDKAKSEFYSNITHEFRTPLTVILGLTDTIQGHDREKEVIKKNSQEVLDLVQQLLDISKAQAGMLQLKMIDDNIVLYLDYLVESFHALAEKKKITLQFSCKQEEIVMAYDREKIRFILSNLISNAIKFTPEGGKVHILVSQEGEELILKVQDNGIGLSTEDQDRIFDRFYQVRKKDLAIQPGDGIGLALIRDLVNLMGGNIRVESMLGKGAIFTVCLPLQPHPKTQVTEAGLTWVQENTGQLLPILPPGTENEFVVLVIEDHADVAAYIERIVSPHFKVVKAFDGKVGWETAINLIPDIIISDVMMPQMDGYHLTEKLKNDPRTNHIPVILLTARAGQEDKLKGLAGGADAYLTKPFHEEEMRVRINKLIENRKQLQESFAKYSGFKPSTKKQDPFLVSVLDILNQNYADEDFGIQELVSTLHLSRMQVHRKLKALTDLSTSQFINHFRLEKGKTLLGDNRLNISEVAYSCGFSDPGYFRKLFVKKYGQSPQAFRNSKVN